MFDFINLKKMFVKIMRTTLVGEIKAYAGNTTPTDWLVCDGAEVSRSTYAKLFSVIGTTYGSGNGSTTFNIPDLTGRVPIGASSGHTIGSKGGSEYIQQHSHSFTNPTISNTSGTHTHTVTVRYRTSVLASGSAQSQAYANASNTSNNIAYTPSGGGGHGHTYSANGSVGNINTSGLSTGSSGNMQPFLTIKYIIYVGGVD